MRSAGRPVGNRCGKSYRRLSSHTVSKSSGNAIGETFLGPREGMGGHGRARRGIVRKLLCCNEASVRKLWQPQSASSFNGGLRSKRAIGTEEGELWPLSG